MRRQLDFLISLSLTTLCLGSSALAQDNRATIDHRAALTVTVSAFVERVRFTAPPSIVQIRLEVYDSGGRKLFDNEVRGGNVLDWHVQDGQAEPHPEGNYLCVVTVKGLSGRVVQRIGSVSIAKNVLSVQAASSSQLNSKQAEAIGPMEEDASLIVLEESDQRTTTVIAHNGEDGQIVRGRGALSIRIGDFFKGTDIEQMRLTAEG